MSLAVPALPGYQLAAVWARDPAGSTAGTAPEPPGARCEAQPPAATRPLCCRESRGWKGDAAPQHHSEGGNCGTSQCRSQRTPEPLIEAT